MPTGLRNPVALGRIVAAMRASEASWTGSLPQQRVQSIATAVLAELQLIGVTLPTLQVANFPGLSGQFDFGPWTLQVDMNMAVGRVTDTPAQRIAKIAALGDVITHEARHCEQWFRMGRLLAAQRRAQGLFVDAREIANRLGINNGPPAAAAAAAPALVGIDRQEAEDWYASVYGARASFREQTYATELNATGTGTGNDWQDSQYARYQRALAEEEDAWGTGTEIQRLYLLHHPGVAVPALTRHAPVRQGVTTY